MAPVTRQSNWDAVLYVTAMNKLNASKALAISVIGNIRCTRPLSLIVLLLVLFVSLCV